VEWPVELHLRVPDVFDATEDAGKHQNSLGQLPINDIKEIPSLFMLV
jgi:hypothetical protein